MADHDPGRDAREPQPHDERLATVRPDPRPSPDHAGHDRWLVVRWVTDPTDLTPAEAAQARALVSGCAGCTALSTDLEVIGRATSTSIVPPRPRDFRITAEQAASAQGNLLDRLRRWLGSPGSGVVRPLAGAALAIGLVLVVVAPNLGSTVGTTGDDAGGREAHVMMAPGGTAEATQVADAPQVAKVTPFEDAPNGAGPEMGALPAPSTQPAADARMAQEASPSPVVEMRRTAAHDAEASPSTADGAPTVGEPGSPTTAAAAPAHMDDTTFALTLLGITLAGAGLVVLVLSWFARRWQDPLLR